MYLRDVQEADAGTYVCVASSYDRVFKVEMEVMLAEALVINFELVSQSPEEVILLIMNDLTCVVLLYSRIWWKFF